MEGEGTTGWSVLFPSQVLRAGRWAAAPVD